VDLHSCWACLPACLSVRLPPLKLAAHEQGVAAVRVVPPAPAVDPEALRPAMARAVRMLALAGWLADWLGNNRQVPSSCRVRGIHHTSRFVTRHPWASKMTCLAGWQPAAAMAVHVHVHYCCGLLATQYYKLRSTNTNAL
jgi:hypothetical protein